VYITHALSTEYKRIKAK